MRPSGPLLALVSTRVPVQLKATLFDIVHLFFCS